jgi:predicted nucleotidyltransferase
MIDRQEMLDKAIRIIVSASDPDRIILFGSRARGEVFAGGDYDLFVLKKGMRDPRRVAQKIYMGLAGFGAPVDVIVEDEEKYERLKDDPYLIYHAIAAEGKVIYEKS